MTEQKSSDIRLDPIEEAVAAVARGEIVVVADDEDRENEGDLIMAADAADEATIAFFVRHTSGVICAALSAGLLGNAHHHSDTGGYTSLFDTTRSPELAMRWAEMAAFTSMIRTHEGNRPRANTQYDDSPELLAHFARMTRIYAHLAPYLRTLSHEAADTGLPIQRPLFLHFEDDPKTYAIQTAYLLGPDLLVAPVIEQGRMDWTTYLPAGTRWVHVWSGEQHEGGRDVTVPAPFGQPPVFYRAGAAEADLFGALAAL